jgi:N-carbamoylputrescine amidase
MRGHSVANGIYVAAANRIGHEWPIVGNVDRSPSTGIQFWGQSFVTNTQGQIVQRASSDREEILIQTCDLKVMEEVRRNWPFFRDRRIDLYDGILKRG